MSTLDVRTGHLGVRREVPSYNTKLSTHTQNESIALKGKDPVRIKIIINDQALSEVSYFKFLGNDLRFDHQNEMKNKLHISKICVECEKKHHGSTNAKIYNSNSMRESLSLLYACETWTIRIKRQRNTISRSDGVYKRRPYQK